MSYLAFKVLHILGLSMVFAALGALTIRALGGGGDAAGRKLAGLFHGIGLLVLFLSGFAMLPHVVEGSFPLWVWLKIALWILVGALIALIRRMPDQAKLFWFCLPLLGAVAGYLAIFKPGV